MLHFTLSSCPSPLPFFVQGLLDSGSQFWQKTKKNKNAAEKLSSVESTVGKLNRIVKHMESTYNRRPETGLGTKEAAVRVLWKAPSALGVSKSQVEFVNEVTVDKKMHRENRQRTEKLKGQERNQGEQSKAWQMPQERERERD